MPVAYLDKALLTGAGFTANFGGYLAKEMKSAANLPNLIIESMFAPPGHEPPTPQSDSLTAVLFRCSFATKASSRLGVLMVAICCEREVASDFSEFP
jgi:hypothetical protein